MCQRLLRGKDDIYSVDWSEYPNEHWTRRRIRPQLEELYVSPPAGDMAEEKLVDFE